MPSTVKRLAASAIVTLSLAACASSQPGPASMSDMAAENDPLEGYNRFMFQVNDTLDQAVIRPVAWTYKTVVPGHFKYQISSFLTNLSTPIVFMNDVLQGNPDRAFNSFMRFILNTTFGIGGINDFAAEAGFPAHDEDFGQTLAVWGVDDGPYLVLPLLGPSNPRDAVGTVVDTVLDPFRYLAAANSAEAFSWGRRAGTAVDARANVIPQYDNIKEQSVDFYATIRSAYRQRRIAEINNQAAAEPGDVELPAYDFEFDEGTDGDASDLPSGAGAANGGTAN